MIGGVDVITFGTRVDDIIDFEDSVAGVGMFWGLGGGLAKSEDSDSRFGAEGGAREVGGWVFLKTRAPLR